jgi:hypothetical protein
MFKALKQAFPFAATAFIVLLLTVGDGTLAIVAFAGCIALMPLIYGPDVDQIAHATRNGDFDH